LSGDLRSGRHRPHTTSFTAWLFLFPQLQPQMRERVAAMLDAPVSGNKSIDALQRRAMSRTCRHVLFANPPEDSTSAPRVWLADWMRDNCPMVGSQIEPLKMVRINHRSFSAPRYRAGATQAADVIRRLLP